MKYKCPCGATLTMRKLKNFWDALAIIHDKYPEHLDHVVDGVVPKILIGK